MLFCDAVLTFPAKKLMIDIELCFLAGRQAGRQAGSTAAGVKGKVKDSRWRSSPSE
jgi:hypothetical protein